MRSFRMKRFLAVVVALAAGAAHAQQFTKPVRILVGATAGGTTDTLARAIAPETSKALGRTGRGREPPGSRRQSRRGSGREVAARRPDAARVVHQPHDQRDAVPETSLRSGRGFHADHHDRDRAERAGRERGAAAEHARGADRVRKRTARQAQLRHRRHRIVGAHGGRSLQDANGPLHRQHPLQRYRRRRSPT